MTATPGAEAPRIDPRTVFVVHGRNLKARNAVVNFLRSVGLTPMSWDTARQRAAKAHDDPNPYIGQILDAGLAGAKAVIVIFTGDDVARLKSVYGFEWLTPQARPNVIFEAGLARGRYPNSTLFVQIGEVRGMSDIGGRHVIRLDGTAESFRNLTTSLKDLGCEVNEAGADLSTSSGDFAEEPEHLVEMPRRRFQILCAALLLAGLLLGGGLSALYPKLFPHEVAYRVPIKTTQEVASAYLVIDQGRKVGSGVVELRVRPNPSYIVLYEVRGQLVYSTAAGQGDLALFDVDQAFGAKGAEEKPLQVKPQIHVPGGTPQ